MNPAQNTTSPELKLALTGSAKEGAIGPPLGIIDIGESESGYLFRVALPGVKSSNLKCDIHTDGSVRIEGFVSDAQNLKYGWEKYEMKLQNLCPAGPFTISFNLPGTVDPRLFSPCFRPDGILEVVVLKSRASPVSS